MDDMDKDFGSIYRLAFEYTMTSIERMYSLYKVVEYVSKSGIAGDMVECGVWKGGSSMVMALSAIKFGIKSRKIYLYDTFEGMSKPSWKDSPVANANEYALDKWNKRDYGDIRFWCKSTLDEVKVRVLTR